MVTLTNMLVQIKNAQATRAAELSVPFSQLNYAVAQLLVQTGWLIAVEKKTRKLKKAEAEHLVLKLKYQNGVGAIHGLKLVSRSSRRVYRGRQALYPVQSGFGLAVLTTPRGILTGEQARQAGVGGEVLFEIW